MRLISLIILGLAFGCDSKIENRISAPGEDSAAGEDGDSDGTTNGDGGEDTGADDGGTGSWTTDDDGDGFSEADGDCDDTAVVINPLATDIVGDGIDQNCDGIDGTDSDSDGYASIASGGTDCDDTDSTTGPPTEWYDDADGDGHGSDAGDPTIACEGPEGTVAAGGDCDDGDGSVYPGGVEICDGLDNDCDGTIEEADCPSGFLPETGLSVCFDDTAETPCPTAGEPFFGQDGNITRAEMALTDHGDGTVTEAVTGLTWQMELADESYTWWDAHTYCEELELGSSTDWRLPNRLEAMTVVDYASFSPAFPEELPTEERIEMWVSAEVDSGSAIYLWAENGGCYNNPKHNLYGVRCVRGTRDPQEWTHHGDGTMEDALTERMWTATHDGVVRNWSEALDYCQALELAGFTNWRLPDIKELRSTLYSSVPAIHYWSSTTDPTQPEKAWITVSGTRGTYTLDKATTYWQVLCTRDLD